MSGLPEYVLDILSGIATADGLSGYIIELSAGSNIGDNFMGLIHRAILRGLRNGMPAELHLIIKLSTENEARRKQFPMDMVFKREVLMYNKILPLFEKFQRDRGVSNEEAFTSFPKCYAAVADEQKSQFVVIMEDLKAKGFDLLSKERPIESNHLFLTVGQLARMHAISFAIKDQQPEVYDELRKITDLRRIFVEYDVWREFVESSFDRAIAVLLDERHIEWLRAIKQNVRDLIATLLADDASDPFGVIGHGDMWLTNILFHHDSKKVCKCSLA